MGIFSWLTGSNKQSWATPASRSQDLFESAPSVSSDWFMPKYRGRYICDWCDDISRLKRDGDLEAALELATGCMNAMVAAAERNKENVMEHYVREVVIIQHKMKAYGDEAQMLHGWLSRGFPAPRQDFRIDLHKRLAKANELAAKSEGRDASQFTAEWKRYLDLEKQQKLAKTSYSAPSSGRSLAHPEQVRPRRGTSRLIPSEPQLLQDSFVAMDFETANRYGGASACQIALVRVERGEIVDRMATLLKPPPAFGDFEFTYLHGISARDVKDAPSWPDIADPVSRFIDGVPVYAHNASFDSGVWRDLDTFFGTQSVRDPFFCSYRAARRYLPGLENYKLPTVVHACAPNYQLDHHRADSDAEACALIVAALQRIAAQGF